MEDDAQFDTTVIHNMIETFIAPEFRSRGLPADPHTVSRFLVELPANGGTPALYIDEQVDGKLVVTISREDDGHQYLDRVEPGEGVVQPSSGWVAYWRSGAAGVLGFDFRRNLDQVEELTLKAEKYLAAARSVGEENLSPAMEMLYAAAELTVQALMLLQAQSTQDHGARREWLRQWAAAQNSPDSHSQVLDDLASKRSIARYSPMDPKLKIGRFERIVDTVQAMIDQTRTHAGDNAPAVNVEIASQFYRHEERTGSRPTTT